MLLADLDACADRPGGASLQVVPPEQDLLGCGKRSVLLDLKNPADVEQLLTLVGHADLLVEGLRPGWRNDWAWGRTSASVVAPGSSTAA